ncbi:hypothetical protein KY285_020499 [Solanum tuberosum]|nr:hypothetical protein KY285_020499 [Solanum tuberosum]
MEVDNRTLEVQEEQWKIVTFKRRPTQHSGANRLNTKERKVDNSQKNHSEAGIPVKLFDAKTGKYLESQIFKYKSKLAYAAPVTKLEEKSSNNNIIQTPLASKQSTSMTENDHECNSHKDGGDDVMNDVIISKLANSNHKDTKAASKSSALNLTPTHKKPTLTSNYPLPPTFNELNPMNYTPRETLTTYSENVNEKPFHLKSYTSTTSTNQMIFEHVDRSGNVHSNNCAPTGLPKIEEDNKDITRGKLSTVGAKKTQ